MIPESHRYDFGRIRQQITSRTLLKNGSIPSKHVVNGIALLFPSSAKESSSESKVRFDHDYRVSSYARNISVKPRTGLERWCSPSWTSTRS